MVICGGVGGDAGSHSLVDTTMLYNRHRRQAGKEQVYATFDRRMDVEGGKPQ
jgi:hypothetical protein